MLINNIGLNKIIRVFSYFILNTYTAKDFPASILNPILILFIDNIRAIENNIFNKNSILNLAIKEKEEINKEKEEELKKGKEKDKDIPEKTLPESKIIKIKRFVIIIFIYIYYNILILGPFNIIKI